MKWTWKLGEVAGIGIYLHTTFLLFLGWVAVSHWQEGTEAAFGGVLLTVALFGCVLLHELGHALMAKRFGIHTRDITLLPIGGVARLERIPTQPMQEFWVALAGPVVNVIIAAALYTWLSFTGGLQSPEQWTFTGGSLANRLLVVNGFLALFNLLPAFPMDGGRVLRAMLATSMDYVRATQIAAGVGQTFALVFGYLGLFGNPILIFIALFVYVGAAHEANAVQMHAALSGIHVRMAMITNFQTLSPDDLLNDAVKLVLQGAQHDIPVVEGENIVGVLTQNNLLTGIAQHGPQSAVRDAMSRDLVFAESKELLEHALSRIKEDHCRTIPVVDRGQLVGLLTMDNVGELIAIQAALRLRQPV